MSEATAKSSRVPLALVALSLIPLLGGLIRLSRISSGSLEPADARFTESPALFAIHFLCSVVYCLLGAFQFDDSLRQRAPVWHRRAGILVVATGLGAALSGVAMTLTYRIPESMQGHLTFSARLTVGVTMTLSLVLAIFKIARREVQAHRAFMIRAYALGQGAGTQVFLLGLPALVVGHEILGTPRDWLMAASWALNLLFAEFVIRRRSGSPQTPTPKGTIQSLGLSMLLASLSTSIVNIALPTLSRELAIPFGEVQWIVLAHLLAVTTLIVSVGRLGDLFGRKRLLLGGLGLFTVAAALATFAPILRVLIFARVLQGVGAATMMALSLALVSESAPKERIGSALGLVGTTSAIGTALGPALGGVLTEHLGWRAIFGIQIPVGVLAFLLAMRFVPESPASGARARPSFDVLGTVLFALAVGSYALAMTDAAGAFGAKRGGLLVLAVLSVLLFVRVEAKAAAPLVEVRMFLRRTLSVALATSALVSTLLMTTLIVGPFYLSRTLGLGAGAVGLVLAVGPSIAAVVGVPAGRLVDRIGTRQMTLAGLAVTTLGSLGLATSAERLGVLGYIVPLAILTAGYALFQTANNTGVMSSVRADERGLASGLLNLSRNLGLVTGASVKLGRAHSRQRSSPARSGAARLGSCGEQRAHGPRSGKWRGARVHRSLAPEERWVRAVGQLRADSREALA